MHNRLCNIKELLCKVTGNREIDDCFGEPFLAAFTSFSEKRDEKIVAASYICSLFLSCITKGFPTDKLHTFVKNAKEEYGYFTFNCKAYEKIYSYIEQLEFPEIPLLDRSGNTVHHRYTKQELFEAFDFYTNQ